MANINYGTQQLKNAGQTLDFLVNLPDGKRQLAVTIVSAFIAGMEAQTRLAGQTDFENKKNSSTA